ncbi:NAD(P)H-dependent oxidoreductase [Eubacterium xylanophilum]|uniref:NAD(P)H-dependent oxidoreductase n=1 Tax=Eubacterium xylanophilum TaxID=39497 RepID=UPI0004B20F01|nr:NAD(P)H-dependent oxidoreductase [Eubacterium xylanophilum]
MDLLIDACARPNSRTRELADSIVSMLGGAYERVNLYEEKVTPLDYERLVRRAENVDRMNFEGEEFRFARQFKDAENIIIAAPFWDFSFPSILKCYIESICVTNLTFRYSETGAPESLCKAKRLIYVTTAGGMMPSEDHGFAYIKQVCKSFFGIEDVICIKAEGLDIVGANVPTIMNKTIEEAKLILEADNANVERWEVYDEERIKTGYIRRRGEKRILGEYQPVIHVCVFNSKGEMLIQQRQSTAKSWPNLWDFSCGGHVIMGENSKQGAMRELREELGLDLDLSEVRAHFTINWMYGFDDYFLIEKDVEIAKISLQAEEVQDVRWATREEIKKMIRSGTFITYYESLVDYIFDSKGKLGAHANEDNK